MFAEELASLNLPQPLSRYAPQTYDAVWAIALALRGAEERWQNQNDSVQAKLDGFDYTRYDMALEFLQQFSRLNFLGVSVSVVTCKYIHFLLRFFDFFFTFFFVAFFASQPFFFGIMFPFSTIRSEWGCRTSLQKIRQGMEREMVDGFDVFRRILFYFRCRVNEIFILSLFTYQCGAAETKTQSTKCATT